MDLDADGITHLLRRITPYAVWVWLLCSGAGEVYALRLYRRARRDLHYRRLSGRNGALFRAALSNLHRVRTRILLFWLTLLIGVISLTLPLLASSLLRALLSLAYVVTFIVFIGILAADSYFDNAADQELRRMLQRRPTAAVPPGPATPGPAPPTPAEDRRS